MQAGHPNFALLPFHKMDLIIYPRSLRVKVSPIEGVASAPIRMYAFIAFTQRLKPMKLIRDLACAFC